MNTLQWAAVATGVASLVLGLIAVLGSRELMSSMYKAPDKTAWGLLIELILGRVAEHHSAPEHRAERNGGR